MPIQQYIRKSRLIVANSGGQGLDLSSLHVKFSIKKSDAETPNAAEILIHNLSDNTATQIKNEFTTVVLQAGYEGNIGTIFSGSIKQVRIGRDNGTDTTVTIYAADGDQAYIATTLNTTLAAGATQSEQMAVAMGPMAQYGVQQGFIADTGTERLPRGKVMYGMSRDYLRTSAQSTGTTWSIQDGKVQVVAKTGVLPGTAVVLSPASGLIGTPEQTDNGIIIQCLLNPMIRVAGLVRLDHATVSEAVAKASTNKPATAESPVAAVAADGIYRVLVVEYQGDTRGQDWYSTLTCLAADASAPPGKEVSPQ